MKRILLAVFLLPFISFGADPIPLMLNTNRSIAWQTNFFLVNGELMTNALVALGYSSGGGSVASTDITDSTVAGRALLTAANAAAQLTALGTAALYEPLNGNKYQATNGNLTTLGALDGAALTNLNGSSIASGTVAAARIDSAISRLASPALSGDPTVPTASPGDNDTSAASTAFVTAAIAAAPSGGGDVYTSSNNVFTGTNTFMHLDITTLNATTFLVGITSVVAELALKANALNPTTTGTFTHGGTNAIITSSNANFNIGKANALAIDSAGLVGIGVAPTSYALDVSTSTRVGTTLRVGATADAVSGMGSASVSSSGGGYFTKGISSAYSLIRSNAPSAAAARGANTLIQEFNTNKVRFISTDASTNETVLATLNTSGIMALNGLQFNQSELQPFSAVTNYVADFDGPTQQTILVTNNLANLLHATNVAAGKMLSLIIRAGTNATVTVVLPRPLWECNTNVATLAANQSLTLSLTGFGPDSNTNVNATVGPVYSR